MNITKKLISIIIIITIVLCSSLNLFNNISYATEGENSNNTSSGNTPENGQQTPTDTEPSGNTTGSEANNEQLENIPVICVTLLVFQLEISGNDIKDLQLPNISFINSTL